jgi:hypothetical protein
MRRVVAFFLVRARRFPEVPLSNATVKSAVARAALDADTTGAAGDPEPRARAATQSAAARRTGAFAGLRPAGELVSWIAGSLVG